MPLNSSDYHLLIVSDLHLSEGRSERTHRIQRNEDFFQDEEFTRFLEYHLSIEAERKWHLIINGDFLDFLQVISTDFDPEFLAYLGVKTAKEARQLLHIVDQQSRFGFDAGPGETVFKLWKILDGHWIFTLALIRFLERGHALSIGRGNHDPEFQYPLVQEHFHRMLAWFYARKLEGQHTPEQVKQFEDVCAERVHFLDWFYYEPGLIWAEHGGQYDAENAFSHWLAPYLPHSDQIEMPWGSFFVRYLFNSIENEEPWADNIKPQSRFIIWLITRRPVLALRFLFGNGRTMLKKMAHAWRPLPADDPRQAEHDRRRAELAQEWNIDETTLGDFDAHQAPGVLREPHGWWRLFKVLTRGWRISLPLLALILLTILIGGILILAQILAPIVPAIMRSSMSATLHAHGALQSFVSFLLISRGFTTVYLLIALGYFIWQLFPHPAAQPYLRSKAKYVREKLGVQYVTMGHTHETDLDGISGEGEYFNTGTWTKVISDDEELFAQESELVFLQVLRRDRDVSCRLMRWHDGANEPRLVKLFSDVGVPKKKKQNKP